MGRARGRFYLWAYLTMSDRDFDLPWFPFWASDFTDSRTVRNMTPEEVGVYILLLCDQWKEGKVSDDPTEWRGVTNHADKSTVEAVLERCFNAVDGGYVNERLENVRQKQVDKRMQKVRAGKASAEARRKSNQRKDKERRSNGVATDVERTNQRSTNESESDTESDTEPETEVTETTTSEPEGSSAAVAQGVSENGGRLKPQTLLVKWIEKQPGDPSPREKGKQAGVAKRLCEDHSRERIAAAWVGMDQLFPHSNGEPWDLFDLERKFSKAAEAAMDHLEVKERRRRAEMLQALEGR